jgi:hypothetical protein
LKLKKVLKENFCYSQELAYTGAGEGHNIPVVPASQQAEVRGLWSEASLGKDNTSAYL